MRFSLVMLRNFRNYPYLEIEIPSGASLFMGANAQGKTNLLEACYYISSLTSPRAERESDLARWGHQSFSLAAKLEDSDRIITVKILTTVLPSVRRKLEINDTQVTRQELLSLFPCVYFSPDDLNIVKGSSGVRRRFIDTILSRQDPIYARLLSRYNDAIFRRNAALKRAQYHMSWTKTLETLDGLVADIGSKLLFKRLEFVEKLAIFTQSTYRFITNSDCYVNYSSNLGQITPDIENIKFHFKDELCSVRSDELARGITLKGPHRDDLEISYKGKSFRYFGSQGQQRSVVLALKMAEAQCLEQSFKTKPVLLLDDVFSELDAKKRTKVLSLCDFGYQVLITSTELPERTGPKFSLFQVQNDNVSRWMIDA